MAGRATTSSREVRKFTMHARSRYLPSMTALETNTFATLLELRHQLGVQVIEIRLHILGASLKTGRNIAERGDAERLGAGFQVRMGGNPPEHLFRQADVLGDQAFIALASNLSQRQPHLEGAKSARILRTIFVVVSGSSPASN